MRPAVAFVVAFGIVAGSLTSRLCRADDPDQAAPLPPLPPPSDASSTTPASGAAIPVVNARVVRADHVDTVVIAQPGSQVTLPPPRDPERTGRYARDPGRTAALIASPIVFGLGAFVSGIAYLSAPSTTCAMYTAGPTPSCSSDGRTAPLVFYDVTVAGVPSAPRWVVGDYKGALIYTGARGASLAAASLIDWGVERSNWMGPFVFGFLVPITLGIVDLATTPHREDLETHDPRSAESARRGMSLVAVTPSVLTDAQRRLAGASLNVGARF